MDPTWRADLRASFSPADAPAFQREMGRVPAQRPRARGASLTRRLAAAWRAGVEAWAEAE